MIELNIVNNKEMTVDERLDRIHYGIEVISKLNQWKALDIIFNDLIRVIDDTWELQILLRYATASLSVKSKIPSRKAYIEKCKTIYPREDLWIGLL
jgi:hypothetical protein